jgi:MFS family permease
MTPRLSAFTSDTFRSLQVRNFKLFFAGQLVSQTGSWLAMVAQTLLVLRLTDSGVALGLLLACQFAPVLVIGPWAGTIADRSDKRRLLLVLQAASLLQSVAMGIVVFTHNESVPVIYALAGVLGVITAFDNPARRAFVVEMVPTEEVANAVSLNSALMTGSRVVGPAAAGVLVVTVGFGWCFMINAATYLAVLYGLYAMRTEELRPSTPAVRGKGQVRAGLRYARSESQLWVPLVMMAAIGTLAFNFSVTIPLLARRSLGGSDTTYTLLLSVMSLGSVIGALGTARRRVVTPRQVVTSAAWFGGAMLLLASSPALVVAFPAAVLLGIGSIAFMTSATTTVQLLAAPEYRGRILALQAMVFLGSTPIGGPIVGWICDTTSPRVGIAVGGVACLAAAAWGARSFGPPEPSRPVEPLANDPAVEAVALAD